jgi:hypothetical protein
MESVRLTLGDLMIIWQRYERMPKRKRLLEQRIATRYYQKSAEVVVSRQRAATCKTDKCRGLTEGRRTEC